MAGAAAKTISQTGMTPTVPGVGGTITVDDASGYPASGKFDIVVDRGLTNEESITISSRSGATFTIGQRGYDGTVASSHTAGQATVELDLSAALIQLVIDHVDDIETAPHSTKLPVGTIAGHDVTPRHQFGAALGTPGTPVTLTPDTAGSAGTAAQPARADHRHQVDAIVPVDIGTANAEGGDASFARGQHVHKLGTGAINAAGMFAAGVINSAALGSDSVIAGKIADGGVSTTAEIADSIIRMAKFDTAETSVDFSGSITLGGVTLGTGGDVYANYWKLGRLVVMVAGFQLGTGGNVTATITFSLPFTPANLTSGWTIPITGGFTAGTARDDSGSVRWSGIGTIRSDSLVATDYVTAGSGTGWNALQPFDWAVNDSLEVIILYQSTS